MALLQGDLRITGNLSAANYPPAADTEVKEIEVMSADQDAFYLHHGFGAQFVDVNVYDTVSLRPVFTAVTYPRAGVVCLGFAEPPDVGRKFRVEIIRHTDTNTQ
ncbi:MAG: hypothetical protein IJJ20_08225 [Thermoguttaceae bacterium]|nr:hypothetical protein [Thermoguttaceae bacterium]